MGSLHALDHWDPQDAHNDHHTDEYTTHTGCNRNNSDNVHSGTELTGSLHALDYWDPQDAHNDHHTDEYTTHRVQQKQQ